MEYIRSIDRAKEKYFDYLMQLVDADVEGHGYVTLCHILHDMEFYWLLDHDENRAEDGIVLREEWYNLALDRGDIFSEKCDDNIREWIEHKPCTVLEMMVALADRIENTVMYDSDDPNRTADWFDQMLINLDLDDFTDDWITLDSRDEIISRVQVALDREYDHDGKGGFWPLHKSRKDQRKVEIWYQMNQWLIENRAY